MELTPDLLLRAYAAGFFPMATSRGDCSLRWLTPEVRGVLPLDGFHVPRRLRRTLRGCDFTLTVDQAPHAVIASCAEVHGETWINHEIERLYVELARARVVHSVEVWRRDAETAAPLLAGGLYGLALGGVFFGESMFSRHRDASKVALVELVLRLRAGGFCLLDVQFSTPHLRRFGVIEVPRDAYLRSLSGALATSAHFPASFPATARAEALAEVLAQPQNCRTGSA